MTSLFLDALNFKNKERPPVWLMRQAGRYMPSYQKLRSKHSFLTLCHQPELVSEITQLPVNELNVDAAILFSDILMVPESIGFKIHFEDSKGPVIENFLKSPGEIVNFHTDNVEHNFSFLSLAIKELKKTLKVPLIGFAGAPFTLASYIIEGKTSRDLKETKKWAFQSPDPFKKIVNCLEHAVLKSLQIQHEAGCDALQLFDSWAHVLNSSHFDEWCMQPLKRIYQTVKSWNKPLIYFCKGSSYQASHIANTGVSAISLDWIYPLKQIRKSLPFIPLQGNLDPEALYMPKELLIKEVKKILSEMDQDPGYIFNLGHGILPDTPYENVQALVETVRNYSSAQFLKI